MTEQTSPTPATARTEKLRAIEAVFGADVAARFKQAAPAGPDAHGAKPPEVDPDRLAWQQNRLIKHLRARTTARTIAEPDTPRIQTRSAPPAAARMTGAATTAPALERLRHMTSAGQLSGEHPAVIAHVLKQQSQAMRVSVLRTLPGRTARGVMQRLRSN